MSGKRVSNNNNNNNNITNPLSLSSTIQRRIAMSAENTNRSIIENNNNRENEETINETNTISNTHELNLVLNNNSDNNLNINNNRRRNNLSNNIISSNNIIRNDFNNKRYNESPNSQFRRLRRLNYIGRQDRHLLLTIYNNNLIQDENNNHIINSHIINNNHQSGNNQINDINNNNIENNLNNNLIENNTNNNHIENNINNLNNINIISRNILNNNNSNSNNKSNSININNNHKNIKDFQEEEKKREETDTEICKEENIGSEIKDTVKCYICFDKITKPKMCPHCHRIACEKCLYNWFINLKKDKCGFCRLKSNFYEMISVPFMDAVVNFVDKFFNKRSKLSETIDKEFMEYCSEHKNELLYYYCLDCGKPYCKTCFVFFGEEKDKHIGHNIIEYEKYKNMSMPLLKKNTDKLESNIQHVEDNIKRCLAYKNSYEHERKVVNRI